MNFADLGLSPEVLRAVEEAGYTQPTPIQEKAIPIVLQGRDVLGCAQTGTGKTAGFALPLIDILASGRAKARMPRALILEPTRELAAQVAESLATYGKYSKLEVALLIGGVSMDEQNRKLERGADILIATPGRLLDHAERGQVMLRGTKILVIDETDRMLDMGFIPDVQRIVKLLPPIRQTLFFSATLSKEIRAIGAEFVSNPKEVSVSTPSSTVDAVRQAVIRVSVRDKRDALTRLLETENIKTALIFLNRKRDVNVLKNSMARHGFAAAPIHGDLAQAVRTETLDKFRKGEVSYLIASDVAARGLDIEALPCVINFDVPSNAEDYVHRIGRTARAGRSGAAFTFASGEDARSLAAIERLIGKAIPLMTLDGVQAPPPEEDDEAEPRRGRGGRRRPAARTAAARKPASAETEKTAPKRRAAPARKRAAKKSANGGAGEAVAAPPPAPAAPKAPAAVAAAKGKQPGAQPAQDGAGAMGGHVPAFLLRRVSKA